MATSSNRPLKIYFDYVSQPARAVLALCKLNNIPYEGVEIRVFKFQHYDEEYANVNPLQKIPAIEDGDFKLSESHAIMRYICNTRDVQKNWYPKDDAKKRALIDRYLDWHHGNTRRCTYMMITRNFPNAENVKMLNLDLETEKKAVAKILKDMETIFLQDKKFITGDEMTIADLSAFCEIMNLKLVSYDLSPYPVLNKWIDRCMENDVLKDVHNVLFKIVAKMPVVKL